MQQRHWTLSRLKPPVAAALALVLAAGVAISVVVAPVTVQFHIGFGIPIFLCAWTRSQRFLWSLALACITLTIARVMLSDQPPNVPFASFVANRIIAVCTLLACSYVTHLMIGLIGALEAHNTDLAEREERIAQQNQTLQQQTSETEMQGRALRSANERLLTREASIEDERQRLRTILTTVPVGVTIADIKAHTITYNAAAGAMLGVAPDVPHDFDAMVEHFTNTERGSAAERSRHGIVRAMNGEEVHGLERDFVFSDGRRLVVLVSSSPLRDCEGKIVGAVSGFVDITQQKLMQGELEQQRREAEESSTRKSRFLAAVSHDIRTPANAISLLAELLQRSSTSPQLASEIPEIARDLKTSALSLVRLVSDVLDLTRFDSGRVELVETEFPLEQLMHDECRQFMQLAKDKGVDFVCHPPQNHLVLRTDRVKLSRVLGNLVGNAVKFTREGTVKLDAAHVPEKGVEIRVTDTGPGIPPEHHERIFDEYFQLKNPQREQEKGSGLGLAICRKLAQAMGATLTVNSTAGQGATFTVTLPPESVVRA